MKSLTEELQSFSSARLKKRSTRVTTATGRVFVETRSENEGFVAQTSCVEEEEKEGGFVCGFVQDLSLDLQVGLITPFLLLSSQDAAGDMETLQRYKVTHVLNVAYGVENAFPKLFTYKTLPVLDLPETKLLSFLPQCFEFIEQVRNQDDAVLLLHCNAGVSRSASVAIAYLMETEKMPFEEAFERVRSARPSVRPNAGFLAQLKTYPQ